MNVLNTRFANQINSTPKLKSKARNRKIFSINVTDQIKIIRTKSTVIVLN